MPSISNIFGYLFKFFMFERNQFCQKSKKLPFCTGCVESDLDSICAYPAQASGARFLSFLLIAHFFSFFAQKEKNTTFSNNSIIFAMSHRSRLGLSELRKKVFKSLD